MFEIVDGPNDYIPCPVCRTERLKDSLEDGHCPFCKTYILSDTWNDDAALPFSLPTDSSQSEAAPTPENYVPVTDDEKRAFRVPYERPKAVVDPDIDRELASRVLCRRRLLPFIKKFRPNYNAGWVHEDICRRLEQFVRDVAAGLSPRLLLMMPPRSGKSEIGSRHFPPWVIGQHPDWEIIAASHTSSLTMSFSRYIRDLMRDPAYTAIFPAARLDPSSQSVESWNILGGGGYLAAGVGSGITGRGAHILLLDDLVKDMEAADSQTIRDNTWDWYVSTAYTRLAPGGGVLGIMTCWHEDDWAGRIQQVMASGDGDNFEIVRYPAINEEGDEYIMEHLPGRPIMQFRPGEPVPPGARLTRRMGTAIHPARYSTESMLRIRSNMFAAGQKRVWQSLYQQNPMPDEGLFFTKDLFKYTPTPPPLHRCHLYQAWDFAITEGQDGDYTVGCTIAQDESDNLIVLDVRRFKSSDSIYIVDMMLDYAQEYRTASGALPLLGVEDGQIWKTLQAQFVKRCSERKQYPSYEVLKPLTDKQVRAHPLRGRMQAGKVWFLDKTPWLEVTVNELARFPAGKHDDIVDSLSWCVRLTLGRHAPKPIQPHGKVKSWKDKLRGLMGEKTGVSHMAS